MSSEATPISFKELALSAPVYKAIQDVGYETPSPIQAASIPPLLAEKDIVGQAQTGTGKTAAFALPLLSRLDLSIKQPQILVLAPTRELAIQVAESFQVYARHLKGFHVLPIYGGQSMSTQLRQLKRGVHVIVGTPGRLMDHLRRKTINLDKLQSMVLDEADEMLKMGFIEDVEWILEQTPDTRQIALFSATMPDAIRKIANRYLHKPIEIKIKTRTATVETITQHYWQVTDLHKLDALTRILEVEDFEAMLIFVRTKNATTELAEKLEARGYSSAALNGDMNQAAREKTIDRLKKGVLDIVVATDVAARGLDVERISHVINYDVPYDPESYVHRIGRTGRAGRKGQAILFVSPRETRMLRAIERTTRQPITPLKLPSRQDLADRRVTQFKQKISDTINAEELGFFEGLLEQFQHEHNLSMQEIAAALAFLAQRERPLVVKEAKEPKQLRMPKEQQRREPKTSRAPKERQRQTQHKEQKAFNAPKEERQKQTEPRSEKPREKRKKSESDVDMIQYRIEVGKDHGVQPKNIVGAIANEAGLENKYIGHIVLHDTYSTIELPDGMPKEIFKDLQNVRVCDQKLSIKLDGSSSYERKPKNESKNKPKKPRSKSRKFDPKSSSGQTKPKRHSRSA